MNNNSLLEKVIMGVGIVTLATMPIWLPHLLGKAIEGCEVGVHITHSGFSPYCKSLFK